MSRRTGRGIGFGTDAAAGTGATAALTASAGGGKSGATDNGEMRGVEDDAAMP